LQIIVLDTNILIDNVHGFAPWVDELLERKKEYRLIIPTIVVSEYLTAQEIETLTGLERSKRYLGLFLKQDLTEEIAEMLGTILRRKMYVSAASLADLIIAATTVHLEAELATKNTADFAKIPNLRFFEPQKYR